MFDSIKELINLGFNSRKIWIIPIILLLVIIALIVFAAQISPVPLFIYPII